MEALTTRLEHLEREMREVRAENRTWRRLAALALTLGAMALGITLMPATPVAAQTTLEQRVAALEFKLLYVSRVGREMVFNAVNVHIRNGGNRTDSANSLGNLIVGFNERRPMEGGVDPNVRTGSHNIIVGGRHNYTSFGGLAAGYQNTISGRYASASGGYGNTASGDGSAVSGGALGAATTAWASVSGGYSNRATTTAASVSGGAANTASGHSSSVCGGSSNTASSDQASVSGGYSNTASGRVSSVSGGDSNTASGYVSSVSGGFGNTAGGDRSTVSGGYERSTTGLYNWRAGGLFEDS